MSALQIYTHALGLKHDTGDAHPENIRRLETLLDLFDEASFKDVPVIPAPEAEYEWLLRAHNAAYLDKLQEIIPDTGFAYADGRVIHANDTILSPLSWEAALHAAGAVCQAVTDIINSESNRAFCAMRPPGHHAYPDHGEGFCLFNNIFIGALHAQKQHGLRKIAIVDFDVHHGNGSDAMARQHDNIFFASSHQGGIYPGSGHQEQDIPGRIINRPLHNGAGSQEFRSVWRDDILPALNQYTPDLIMISAGFDAHKDDPLAGLNLTTDDFGWVTEEIVKIATKHSNGRVVSVLEGGYNLEALKNSTRAHLQALAQIK